mmetsp:Transcript_12225/g.1098  ORF Transcript_12225/g.1098 Transcript_12225/m.1098 type:complete len:84 (+) Transcript_12225:287-538(+)
MITRPKFIESVKCNLALFLHFQIWLICLHLFFRKNSLNLAIYFMLILIFTILINFKPIYLLTLFIFIILVVLFLILLIIFLPF